MKRTRDGRITAMAFALLALASVTAAQAASPAAWWRFDTITDGTVTDTASHVSDAIAGHVRLVGGVAGQAVVFDGYTTIVTREAGKAPAITDAFTIEAWVALGAYPWNWCPVVDQSNAELQGYALEIGPRGGIRLRVAADGRWRTAVSEDYVLPLRKWMHIAGRYDGTSVALFVNGRPAGATAIDLKANEGGRPLTGRVTMAEGEPLLIGAVRAPERPSNWHRFGGDQPSWFSLDGLLDEVKIYTTALAPGAIAEAYRDVTPAPEAALAPRVLPAGPPGPGRFGAYYTTLKYYPEWDALWRVGPDADVLVRFDESPARVVFWRGTQYSPVWVTGNGLWMADQSVEAWDDGHTYEHMNDKQNRYSHVKIVEQSDARVVVHWRYALVNVKNQFWNVTPRLENGAWIDEYYYLYPDAAGVRKVTWQHGTLGAPIQFQESIVLAQPGQLEGDVVDRDYATVGNLKGETQTLSYVENPGAQPKKTFPPDLTIQMHHFKSREEPFIVFEKGDKMDYLRDMDARALSGPGSSNHWPVAQILSDGRTSQAADRVSHFLGFPISDPPVHQGTDGRDYWNGLYGMTDRPFADLVTLARSWDQAPALTVTRGGFTGGEYDQSERAYNLMPSSGRPSRVLELRLAASPDSPADNVALVIRGWGDAGASLHVDGKAVPRGPRFRLGYRHTLDGTDLIVWIELQRTVPVTIELSR
jgi:hypothetical protein